MALKLLARDPQTRPQDDIDLDKLAEVATDADFARLHDLAMLIQVRGYHRSRDLVQLASNLRDRCKR
jgi:hypothetical protein